MTMTETVLVVEDDPLIRMIVVEQMEDAGFVVYDAEDADEALRILADNPQIGAVFTDVDMPGSMNGVQLALAVGTLYPRTAIAVASGFLKVPRSILPVEVPFFTKPYDIRRVIAGIRGSLESIA